MKNVFVDYPHPTDFKKSLIVKAGGDPDGEYTIELAYISTERPGGIKKRTWIAPDEFSKRLEEEGFEEAEVRMAIEDKLEMAENERSVL